MPQPPALFLRAIHHYTLAVLVLHGSVAGAVRPSALFGPSAEALETGQYIGNPQALMLLYCREGTPHGLWAIGVIPQTMAW